MQEGLGRTVIHNTLLATYCGTAWNPKRYQHRPRKLVHLETMETNYRKLGIERRLSTAFHPQTASQTERTNAIPEQYLRAYGNYQQDNWNQLLPLAEFAYNNGYPETIKTIPFYANYGRNPEHQLINLLAVEKKRR